MVLHLPRYLRFQRPCQIKFSGLLRAINACSMLSPGRFEILFLEKEMKTMIEAIRQMKDVDSIPGLRTVAKESIDRIGDHKLQEEQTRLATELAARAATSPHP